MYILTDLCPDLFCTSARRLFNLAIGSSENMQVRFSGDCLYSIRAVRLASMTGYSSVNLDSSQS